MTQPEECGGGWDLANYSGVGEARWFCIDCKAERPEDCPYRSYRKAETADIAKRLD